MADGDSRIWAKRDRTIVPPQRVHARSMRANPTEAERKLWWHLRHRLPTDRSHFRRQVQIGRYIADFVSHKAKLIIEVDGGQHGSQIAADSERTRLFEANGYRVLRYWNNDVLRKIDGVLEDIQRAMTATPTPVPSPQGGGEPLPQGEAAPRRPGFEATRVWIFDLDNTLYPAECNLFAQVDQ
jgi:very-short-patch-repair endonuclease